MPVPVSTTHANGVGLKGANASELPTEGPFARLKAQAAQNQAASKVGDATSEAVVERPPADQMDTSEPSTSSSSDIVIVRNLNFAYPGLGELARLWRGSARAFQGATSRRVRHAAPDCFTPSHHPRLERLQDANVTIFPHALTPSGRASQQLERS